MQPNDELTIDTVATPDEVHDNVFESQPPAADEPQEDFMDPAPEDAEVQNVFTDTSPDEALPASEAAITPDEPADEGEETPPLSPEIERLVKETLLGWHGMRDGRRRRLSLGSNYEVVQAEVERRQALQ